MTVLHTVKGMDLEVASSALTGYMAGSTWACWSAAGSPTGTSAMCVIFAVVLTIVSAALVLLVNALSPAVGAVIGA